MILLITTSSRGQECPSAVQSATGHPAQFASSLQDGPGKLRVQDYSAVVFAQFLIGTEPEQTEQILPHFGAAIPIFVNFAIWGIDRVVRESAGVLRRQRARGRGRVSLQTHAPCAI